jgi:hypothetical protein
MLDSKPQSDGAFLLRGRQKTAKFLDRSAAAG